jgi:hypothetical protein
VGGIVLAGADTVGQGKNVIDRFHDLRHCRAQ